ncbi:Bcl10-interacting CARD protein [Acipenser ruthenus]|uniref:Caspase recruitment domain-containing protein 19 n=1 Tax=Acipenser ruthenus TaxID=7906 RepID=A0A662YQW8_ACIRT|nr:Bcl10-interacting CARD protein [Acipenser ruthenus]
MGVMKPDSAALGGKSCHHGRDEEVRKWRSETDTYCDQLEQDSWFLKNDYRLSAQLVEKLVLQLNRIHPNVLSDKEAQKFRDVKVPTKTRLADLLSTLKEKGEEACHEFYRALHIHAEQLYISLPSRKRQRDTYCDQLEQDTWFLKNDYRLSAQLVEKLVLQLNRIHPNVLSDKEAQKFRDVKVPTKTRLADLLSTLKEKGEEACHEFYRALHIHAEQLYISLPSRKRQRDATEPNGTNIHPDPRERFVLNEREDKAIGDAKKILGFTAIGLSRRAKAMLISYAEDQSKNQ